MSEKSNLVPSISLLDAIMIVVGSMIGSGIFIVHAEMTRYTGSSGWLTLAWIITAILTVTAAISYGKLGTAFPLAGGQYVYLKEGFNDKIAFLYGWSLFAVIQTGTIAAVGVAFAKYVGYFVPLFEINQDNPQDNLLFQFGKFKVYNANLLAIASILFLSFVNSLGVKHGKWFQTISTLTKVGAILILLVCGYLFAFDANIWHSNWQNAFELKTFYDGNWQSPPEDFYTLVAVGALGVAMVGSVFSSICWEGITFLGGEIKNPKKNIARSLVWGTIIASLIYLAFHFLYIGSLSLNDISTAKSDRVAVALSQKIFGPEGVGLIAMLIILSTFSCNNGLVMAGSRVFYTMSLNKLFFKSSSKLNKQNVPANSIWIQAIMSILFCLSGTYNELLDMVSIVVVIFYILTILVLFRMRDKFPERKDEFKCWGFPYVPLFYIIVGTLFCFFLLFTKTFFSLSGLVLVLIGIPVYHFVKKKSL